MATLRSLLALATFTIPALSAVLLNNERSAAIQGLPLEDVIRSNSEHVTAGSAPAPAPAPAVSARQSSVGKAVFAHYMVGGLNDSSQAVDDVNQAKAVGFDAFALNTKTIDTVNDPWMTTAVGYLFDAADSSGFKLFFSFDMSGNSFQPSDIPAFIQQYAGRDSYYKVNGQPFVSTFWGGNLGNDAWQQMRTGMANNGQDPFFVPDFDDNSGYANDFFSTYPVADGAFSWDTAWPAAGDSPSQVGDDLDAGLVQQAHSANKVYMMPLSSFQFKYLGADQDYFRIGDTTLPERFEQVLQLQPDLVEFITWNDAGESHYIGNFYESQIGGTIIGDYANDYDHSGWHQIITPFITAYKNGVTSGSGISSGSIVGTLWYRPLLVSAGCSSSIRNYRQGQDTANFAVVLPSAGYKINVYSNNNQIASIDGQQGLNYKSVAGLAAGGGQRLEVVDSSGNVVATATGTKDVQAEGSGSVCNWNYEVVGF